MAVIVVSTDDFELYHDLVQELRNRQLDFTTVSPGSPIPDGTTALIEGPDDDGTSSDAPRYIATPAEARAVVERILADLRGGRGRTVIGVDPGDRPGIAILDGDLVVAAFHVPLEEAVSVIATEVADEPDAVVRIGDGARLKGARIINELEDVRIEIVDEQGTTPYLGAGARGLGDVIAAINIARLDGTPVQDRAVEPTPGELGVIKDRSRELSPVNREIDNALAERVAYGELTIEEALDRHRTR